MCREQEDDRIRAAQEELMRLYRCVIASHIATTEGQMAQKSATDSTRRCERERMKHSAPTPQPGQPAGQHPTLGRKAKGRKYTWRVGIMATLAVAAFCLLPSALCFAQTAARYEISGSGNPSGSCVVTGSGYSQVYVDRTTGKRWACQGTAGTTSGTWKEAAAAAGAITGSGVSGRVVLWTGTSTVGSDADFTFSGDTATFTKGVASTNFTIGGGSALTSSGAGGTAVGLSAFTADSALVADGSAVALKAIGSCSAASSALTYNTTTHLFGCNTITGASPVGNDGDLQKKNGTALAASGLNDNGTSVTFTERVLFPDGTAATPTITFNSNGSGLYVPGGTAIAISQSGAQAFQFNLPIFYIISNTGEIIFGAANDVGIGRASLNAIESNNGTIGTWRDFKAREFIADATVTAGGTTGAQTINKSAGSVNFAATATSLVVTNSLVTANSIIICTVATNDATLKSAQCVAGSGTFTMFANAAATAETRVNFWITN
jgi:hypothetical protein